MSEAPRGRGRDRRLRRPASGADGAAVDPRAVEAVAFDAVAFDAAAFDLVVGQLAHDRAWRRRVGLVHLRHRASSVTRWMLHGFAELGCWFACVPPQRCSRSTASSPRR